MPECAFPRRRRSPLPKQIAPLAYWDFRDRLAAAVRAGKVRATAGAMLEHAAAASGINRAMAAEWVERFCGHLDRDLVRRWSPAP